MNVMRRILPSVFSICGLFYSGLASAEVVARSNVSFTISLPVFIPCANNGSGEIVDLTGELHELFIVNISDSGNVTVKNHTQPQGISGIGRNAGYKYQGTGVSQSIDQIKFSGISEYPIVYTYVNNFRIIGQGTGNNYIVHENTHMTVNANGTVTAYVDNFNTDCK